MATIFDPFFELVDVWWLQARTVVIFGLGRVGKPVAERLVRSGIGEIVLIDGDLVSLRNVVYGYPHSGVGCAKVTQLRKMLEAIDPIPSYYAVRRRVRTNNLNLFDTYIGRADCVAIFIDSFVVAAALAEHIYSRVPCVAAVELAGVEVGDVGFSYPGRTPCLSCTMQLRRRIAGHGGQALPDAIDYLALIATKMILGICLMQRDGTKCKGYEYYGHLLDPARCRGFVYNRPNDFIDQARDDFPCYFQLLEVVTTASRPHCPACRQYSTTPF